MDEDFQIKRRVKKEDAPGAQLESETQRVNPNAHKVAQLALAIDGLKNHSEKIFEDILKESGEHTATYKTICSIMHLARREL